MPTGFPNLALEPRIVPRAEHCISRQDISSAALKVLYKLHEAGYQAFLVGGGVRDLLLGLKPKDFDIATNALPEQVEALFRNCRLIGRRFRLAHIHFSGEIIEVATFRGAAADGDGDRQTHDDGMIVRDNVYGSIEEDVARRDFSVNALYYNIADFSVWDYVGGIEDLSARRLRLLGSDPHQRIVEDPVRMLRAVRLATKLGLTIDEATDEAIRARANLLGQVPPARLFDEVLKLFLAGHGAETLKALVERGLFGELFPDAAGALADPAYSHLADFIDAALLGTDDRIASGQTASPAFLFAAMLYPALCQALNGMPAPTQHAQIHELIERLFVRQSSRVAIPRRFSTVTHEIWASQERFLRLRGRSPERFMALPRFRAAFDFLVLRARLDYRLAELCAWWLEAQQHVGVELDAILQVQGSDAEVAVPERRRRRRRGGTRNRGPRPDPQG